MTNASTPRSGEVVLILVDFLDGTGSKVRPAVVLSTQSYNANWGIFVYAPITGSSGPVGGAIEIDDLGLAGLNRASFCRGTLFTAEINGIRRSLGNLSPRDVDKLRKLIRETLAI
jgi:mRNA-degrading endonuclease toxin of MazEF toxin-antitoxin module